jgi:hypothetical protein
VSVDVGVTSAGDAVGGAGLGLGARAARVAVAVLPQSVLSVVLAGHRGGDAHRGSDGYRGGCIGQGTQDAGVCGGQSHQTGDDHLHKHLHLNYKSSYNAYNSGNSMKEIYEKYVLFSTLSISIIFI